MLNKIRVVLYNQKIRGYFYQAIVFFLIALSLWFVYQNISANYAKANISSGFAFLDFEASFDVGETIIPYTATDPYSRVLLVGVLNTLKVSFYGVLLSLIIGALIGILRLSKNWLASNLSYFYIEANRNTPLLIKLFYCYAIIVEFLPNPKDALNPFYGTYLSNRGIKYLRFEDHWVWDYTWVCFILGFVVAFFIRKICLKHQENTGKIIPFGYTFILLPILFPILLWLAGGMPTDYKIPEFRGFNFENGNEYTPEFTALIAGLVFHTSAYIAEVIRAGIQSVPKGQVEAAASVGLKSKYVMFMVILPQAFRVIIPPLTNQILNLIKNSSLAVAIGYPDFVSVANTTMNQTGQSIEGIMLIMLFYLTFSLLTSVFMNWFNKKVKLVER